MHLSSNHMVRQLYQSCSQWNFIPSIFRNHYWIYPKWTFASDHFIQSSHRFAKLISRHFSASLITFANKGLWILFARWLEIEEDTNLVKSVDFLMWLHLKFHQKHKAKLVLIRREGLPEIFLDQITVKRFLLLQSSSYTIKFWQWSFIA